LVAEGDGFEFFEKGLDVGCVEGAYSGRDVVGEKGVVDSHIRRVDCGGLMWTYEGLEVDSVSGTYRRGVMQPAR